jgi:uncharacterized protein YqeY
MYILPEVQKDQLQARKDRDSCCVNLLTTLLGEFDINSELVDGEKFISEESMQAIIKKFIKNAEFSIVHCASTEVAVFKSEIAILKAYLPVQLTEEQLTDIINNLPVTFSIGQVMGHLKQNHNGLYDGKLASEIIRNRDAS